MIQFLARADRFDTACAMAQSELLDPLVYGVEIHLLKGLS